MAYDISTIGNYILIHNTVTGTLTDRPAKDVVFAKVKNDSDRFSVYYNDKPINGLSDIVFSDFRNDGLLFSSLSDFETFTKSITGSSGGSSGSGGSTEAKQDTIIAKLDTLISLETSGNTKADEIKVLITATNTALGGIDTKVALTNTKIDELKLLVDGLEGLVSSSNFELISIKGFVDGLEAGQTVTNSELGAIKGFVDSLESQIANLILEVDQMEELTTQLVNNTSKSKLQRIMQNSDVTIANIYTGSNLTQKVFNSVTAGLTATITYTYVGNNVTNITYS